MKCTVPTRLELKGLAMDENICFTGYARALHPAAAVIMPQKRNNITGTFHLLSSDNHICPSTPQKMCLLQEFEKQTQLTVFLPLCGHPGMQETNYPNI